MRRQGVAGWRWRTRGRACLLATPRGSTKVTTMMTWRMATCQRGPCGDDGTSRKADTQQKDDTAAAVATAAHPRPTERAFWASKRHWRSAGVNTLRCLVGCSLGDLSTLFGLAYAMPGLPMHVTMPAAMAAGIATSITLETVLLKRELLRKISWRTCARADRVIAEC